MQHLSREIDNHSYRWRITFRLLTLALLIGAGIASLALWGGIRARVQYYKDWKTTLENAHCDLHIREINAGKNTYGPQREEVDGVGALYWSVENEETVIEGLNALGTVKSLSIGGREFSENSLWKLKEIPPLERLTFYDVGVQDFDSLPSHIKKSVLSLTIHDEDSNIKSLAALGDCQNLTELRLNWLKFHDRCEWLLQLTRVETLVINGSTGVSNFIPFLRSNNLKVFLAVGTDLEDTSLAVVACSPSLQTCFFSDTPLTDHGLAHFHAHPTLETLWIDRTNVSDESFHVLDSLPSLKELRLMETNMSPKAIEDFRRRRPEVTVIDEY